MGFSTIRAKAFSPAVRQALQQPGAISAIASLGIHALVFALLPILPYAALVEEKEPDIRQSVEVVELSPEEQARLPELPASQIDLPPLLDSLPPAVTDLPPLPVPGQSTSPPAADDLFSDPFFNSSLPNFSIPTFPQTVPYPPAPQIQIPPPQSPAVTPSPSPAPSPNQPEEGLPSFPLDGSLLNPPREQSGTERTETNQEQGDVAANNGAATPQPDNTPASPTPQPRSDAEIIAGLQQDVAERQQRIALQRQLTYSPDGTADDSNYNAYSSRASWASQLEKDYGVILEDISLTGKKTIEATFPPEACERVQEEVSADFGVLVDPDGKPIGGLAVLRSSGYEFFNNRGGEAVMAETYDNATGKNVPYLVTVVFPYTGNSCAGNAEGEPVS